MSAAEIPNLLDKLRTSRVKRVKTPNQTPPLADGESKNKVEEQDKVVQATDSDASAARWSAVRRGYLRDDYAQLFVKDLNATKYPIINRGKSLTLTCFTRMRLNSWLQARTCVQVPLII
jgi:hypothetical protein